MADPESHGGNHGPVGVVGAGTMGAGIAQVFAQAGYDVTLSDVSEEAVGRGRATVERGLDRAVERGRLGTDERAAILGRVGTATGYDALGDCSLVVEAVFEDVATKRSVIEAVMPRLGPDAIYASNTSSISITMLAGASGAARRVAGMHFFNPVPVLPLVEVVKGLETADTTVDRLRDIAVSVGKTPVVVHDAPGFVANRIAIPMVNEAIFCLENGVAGRDEIDSVMKLGLNHPMGPLELADLIGLDVCLGIMEVLHRDLGEDKYRPAPRLRQMVAAGLLGRKTKRGFYAYD